MFEEACRFALLRKPIPSYRFDLEVFWVLTDKQQLSWARFQRLVDVIKYLGQNVRTKETIEVHDADVGRWNEQRGVRLNHLDVSATKLAATARHIPASSFIQLD